MANDILVRGFTDDEHQKLTEAANKAQAKSTGGYCRHVLLKSIGVKQELKKRKDAGKRVVK